MSLWGWIPSLVEGRDPHPIPRSLRTGSDLGSTSHVKVIEDSLSNEGCDVIITVTDELRIHVDIVSGFFVISERLQEIAAIDSLDEIIYHTLKRYYHVDVTHEDFGGLCFVNARTLEEAVSKTASMFVSWVESMDAERIYGNLPAVSEYMARHGFIKYGLSFVDSYKGELGNEAAPYEEILTSLNMFYETSYDHYKDEVLERLTKSSTDLAAKSARINVEVMALSKFVMYLTMASIIIALMDLVMSHVGSDGLVYAVAAASVLLLIGWLIFNHLQNEAKTSDSDVMEMSSDDAMSYKGVLCTFGAIVSIILFAICAAVNLMDVSQSISLCILTTVLLYVIAKI